MTVQRGCWAFVRGLDVCGGVVTWTRDSSGGWHGRCSKCGATGAAASGERRELERRAEG